MGDDYLRILGQGVDIPTDNVYGSGSLATRLAINPNLKGLGEYSLSDPYYGIASLSNGNSNSVVLNPSVLGSNTSYVSSLTPSEQMMRDLLSLGQDKLRLQQSYLDNMQTNQTWQNALNGIGTALNFGTSIYNALNTNKNNKQQLALAKQNLADQRTTADNNLALNLYNLKNNMIKNSVVSQGFNNAQDYNTSKAAAEAEYAKKYPTEGKVSYLNN